MPALSIARRAPAAIQRLGRGFLVALFHAALAGAGLGLIELVRLRGEAPIAGLLLTALGLTILGGVLAGLPLLGIGRAVAAVPWLRRWWSGAREPGPSRVAALAQLGAGAIALAALWVSVYAVAAWSHGRFVAAGAVGVLVASAALLAAAAIAAVTFALTPWLGCALGRRRLLVRATSGWSGRIALVGLVVGAVAAGVTVLGRAAPAYDFRPAYLAATFVALLAAVVIAAPARRLGRRAGLGAGAALLALALASLFAIGRADAARTAIAGHGIPSLEVLRALWQLSDGDGDGYAGRFGGADCDDTNAAVRPDASEIPDNGVDDNCAGGDVGRAELAPRLEAVPSRQPDAPRRNVLLISIDALRADHTSAYGYARSTTPTLEALAARGARFAWAISASPTTRRAIPALMTGRYASTIAFKAKGWPPTIEPKRHTLLGEAFHDGGYQTQAILCCTTLFNKAAGVVAGIDDVDATAEAQGKSGRVVGERARAWLAGRKGDPRPFFLWLHFLDPHNPYTQIPGAPTFGKAPIDRYDSEIAFVDAQIGSILATLESVGLGDTIVAITADHGDEFREHGGEHHGHHLYNEVERVPLVIAVPGATARVIDAPVSQVDIGATLLDLVGLARPAGQNGRSLAGAVLTGEAPPDRMVLAELISDRNIPRNLKAGYYGDWKVLWDLDANTWELYSLSADPLETDNRLSAEPDVARELEAQLRTAIDRELTLLPGEERAKPSKAKPSKPKPPNPAEPAKSAPASLAAPAPAGPAPTPAPSTAPAPAPPRPRSRLDGSLTRPRGRPTRRHR